MSRVDEALRRAERARQTAAEMAATPVPIGADVAAFQAEPFPIEMPERRRERTVSPPPVAPSFETAAPAPKQPVVPAPAATTSRFVQLDAELAAKVVVDQTMRPGSREQYRRLAATLHHSQIETGLKVVMIASAVVGEGKTLTASNLALTLSES